MIGTLVGFAIIGVTFTVWALVLMFDELDTLRDHLDEQFTSIASRMERLATNPSPHDADDRTRALWAREKE